MEQYFEAGKESEKLSKIVVVLKNEFCSAGLDLASFEFDDLTKGVIPKAELGVAVGPSVAGAAYSGVDERVIEVLGQLTTRLEKIEPAIKFQKVGGRPDVLPLFASAAAERGEEIRVIDDWKECPYGGKGATGGTAAYCMPADGEGAAEAMHTLALCQIFQVAADDGPEAFAAAVAEYGAPAVLAGGESDDIDVSAYGSTVSDSGSGVLTELEVLTSQVKAMEENVGVHFSQVSLLGDDGVDAHHAPVSALFAVAMADDAPQQVVPQVSGASAVGVQVGSCHYGVPTEEFPGGVELVPVRHYVPSMTIDPLISTVACSFEPAATSFVEPSGACEHLSIDKFLAGSEVEELAPSESEKAFVEAPGCASAVRRQQVVGCGAPPFGLRPHFIMFACFIGLLAFGIAGVAAGFAGGEIDGINNNNIYNSVTTETPVMCVGHVCIYSGFDTLSPVVQNWLLQVVGSALAAGDPAVTGGGTAAAASVYGGVSTNGEP
ncbi:hypothetical protein CYMTET_44460 [Cymbomonas tetramitiformis]|uniref:Uncharacterized protein n=1 Tax=Cymbomonas tetramitiformis TaxID=36881 RepID=A0AAE0EZK8_9CHLO|nr:hypothetical protein CYMTET_44460 [Cymbomonas tetramitiformis]